MDLKKSKTKEGRSFHSFLILWLLAFAFVPLAFITGFSLIKYEKAINQELEHRLIANNREIRVIFEEFEKDLETRNLRHASDKALTYFLTTNNIRAARELADGWIRSHAFTQRLSIFNREGRLEISLFRDENGGIGRQTNLEGRDVFLSDSFRDRADIEPQMALIDFTAEGSLDLIMFSRVTTATGVVVGYIEEILRVDANFIKNLTNRMNVELIFFSEDATKLVASHADLKQYRHGFFIDHQTNKKMFDLNIRDQAFGFMTQNLNWGQNQFYVSIGASKQAAKNIINNIYRAFGGVVGVVVLLLVGLSFLISRIMLQPIQQLVQHVQNIDFNAPPERISRPEFSELGVLTESFNDMLMRVHQAQKELKENISKLEQANIEIKSAQAQLVQAAKMASLGQLVAGVAHELNNPIGFIYSNMEHLRDYSQKLMQLVEVAEKKPRELAATKEKIDYEYILSDLPKLIKSCEDGARRTRDIVVSLRSFSRLEETKAKEIDIHEGIDSTLSLLGSEFKSRIKVHKKYGDLPLVTCFASEINQVFMNILSNAAHAIQGEGEIFISTRALASNQIEVSVRDTGVGMSKEVQERLFDPFFTTKDVGQGTGLGLSITYGIIKKHNGQITVQSEIGRGTEFKIILPVHI